MTGTRATVTYDMLLDLLASYPILGGSPITRREFLWASSIRWEKGIIPEKEMVIVCRDKAAQQAASLFPEAFLLILADDLSARPPHVENQHLTVRAETADNILQKLQNAFLRMQSWQGELKGITRSERMFGDMVKLSSSVIGSPLILYSPDGHVVGKSLSNSAPPIFKSFFGQEKGVFDFISLIRRTPVRFSSRKGLDVYVDHRQVISGKDTLFYLVALHAKQPSKGQQDLLGKLCRSISEAIDNGAEAGRSNISRHSVSALFSDLANQRYVGRSYLDDCASLYGFTLDSEFRLLRFKTDADSGIISSSVIDRIREANNGKSLIAIYGEDLLALLHSKDLDDSLSTKTIEEELAAIVSSFSGYVAISQVFNDISNFHYAYDQTALVAKYREYIDVSKAFVQASKPAPKLCYTFEEAFMFALVDSNISQEMRDFAFSHTILEKLINEDRANGSEDTRILASYLNHERKATAVAEELHMHRNTVLYRIDKIEKRFGLDFDQEWSRNRVVLDLSILYCKIAKDPELNDLFFGTQQNDE